MSAKNQQIGGRAPSKKQINLVSKEKPHTNYGRLFGILFLIIAVLGGIGYYGYTGLEKINSLNTELSDRAVELLQLKMKSSEYDQVEEDYLRYSFAHLTNEEKNTLSPLQIIKKIEELVVPYGFVTEMKISGNTVDFTVYSEDVGKITDSLRGDPMVQTVTPKSESKQESEETITVTENVSAMIMKTIGGVQVVSRSDTAAEGEEAGEAAEAAAQKKETVSEDEKETDRNTEADLGIEGLLSEGDPNVQVTIVIPPVLSTAQLSVTFHGLEDTKDEQ